MKNSLEQQNITGAPKACSVTKLPWRLESKLVNVGLVRYDHSRTFWFLNAHVVHKHVQAPDVYHM